MLTIDGLNILLEKVVASRLIHHSDSNTDSSLQCFICEMMDQQRGLAGRRHLKHPGLSKSTFSVMLYSCCIMDKHRQCAELQA